MAKMLSVRIETSKKSKGQNGHDHSNRPAYADGKRKHLNKTIFGDNELAINEKVKFQSKYVIGAYNANSDAKREAANSPRERKKIGSWRKTTATHKKAIVSFSSEVRADKENIERDKLDQCALNFFNDLCAKNNCELTYIVRHDDETTPHYHAMFTNFNSHEMKPLKFQMGDLSRIQDQAGEAFSSMGISRGVRRGERLDIAETNNPRYENEDLKDYNKRIYKIANVVHRTVAKLRDDLPKEVDAKQAELDEVKAELAEAKGVISQQNDIVNSLKSKLANLNEVIEIQKGKYLKNKAYLEKAETKLATLNDENIAEEKRINKNIGIYERREQAALTEIIKLEKVIDSKKGQLNKIIATGQNHLKINNQRVADFASIGRDSYLKQFEELKAQAQPNINKINKLEQENALLRDKLVRNIEAEDTSKRLQLR